MFFQQYFPQAKFTNKFLIPEIIVNMAETKNLFMEVATSRGRNLRRFLSLGWTGRVVGFDLWDSPENTRDTRCPKPIIEQAELVQGNVFDTLVPIYNGEHIDVLFLDLDGDPAATMFTLNVLAQGLTDSFIFVDEFYNSHGWRHRDAKVIADWLIGHNINFDMLYYTQYGALIKTGSGHSSNYLDDSLNSYVGP